MCSDVVYKQAEDCLLEDMDGEPLLYSPKSTITLHLNASAALVWSLCDSKRSVNEIISLLKQAYPDQAEQVVADVEKVVKELLSHKVLEIVS